LLYVRGARDHVALLSERAVFAMRPAYVRVEQGDLPDGQGVSFIISPCPFVWNYGEILVPTKAEQRKATSYEELCEILMKDFHIPKSLLPSKRYFKPTRAEKEKLSEVYRTVPEGMGEPEWRIKARESLIRLLEEAQFSSEKGVVSFNGRCCYSTEELQEEMEAVAEKSAGRKRIRGQAYQPDYDVLTKEILNDYADFLTHIGLKKQRRF